MKITVTNITTTNVSTDVGLLAPSQALTRSMNPVDAYKAAADMKSLVDKGFVTVVVSDDTDRLDVMEPATVGTSVADGAVTSGKLASGAVIAGKIATGGLSAAAQLADGVVVAAKAKLFVSAEQTGTGAAMDIAHGLAAVPSVVMWSLTDVPDSAIVVTEGAHDATNVKLTATTGLKFKVMAWA